MNEWKRTKLSDFLLRCKIPINIENDKEYKRVTIRTKHQGVSVRDTVSGKKIGTKKQFILRKGQFVLSKIDARYGAFGIAPDEVDGAIITGNFWAYDIDNKLTTVDWINNYTNSAAFYDLCERASSGITHRKYLDENVLLNHELHLPEVDEQRRILDGLESQKSNISNLQLYQDEQKNIINQLRQQILQEAIEGKLTAEWRKEYPELINGENHASKLLIKIKMEKERLIKKGKIKKDKPLLSITDEEKPFALPDGWLWCRLGDVCSKIGSGSTPRGSNYSAKGVLFFRSQNVYDDGLVYDDIKFISPEIHEQMKGTAVIADDLLLNITGGSLGRCALIPEAFKEGNVSQHVCIIRSILISKAFMHKIVLSPLFQKMIFKSTTGAGREGLPKYNLEQFLIPIAPLTEQQVIVARIDKLMTIIDELEEQVTERKEQSEMLMQSVLREAFEST